MTFIYNMNTSHGSSHCSGDLAFAGRPVGDFAAGLAQLSREQRQKSSSMSRYLNVVLVAALCGAATADLPVHCLKQQVEGDWDFFLGNPSSTRSSCGHGHPDIEGGQPSRDVVAFNGAKTSTQRISLHNPNVAKSGSQQERST